jgi:cytochrome c oxidase subunit 2
VHVRRLRGYALLVVLPAACCGCNANPAGERMALGKEVYTRECARCHQIDGGGVPGVYPNLAGNPIVKLGSFEPTVEIVLKGREAMPAFGGQLPEQKIAAVITYIRHAWGNHASSVDPAQVK